ncbi:MAG: MBL fold metallo-hydrolase [Acutalibacter sp.]|jgi:hydroxyacylglutathione hydrolase
MIQTSEYAQGLFLLDDGRVRQFLFLGEDNALLIDTGFPDSHIQDTVRQLTDNPLQVLMTHGDMDHTGGLEDFGQCWLHPGDWDLVHSSVTLHPLEEGNRFSCGSYQLEVVEIPGHTHGSVAFFDAEHRLLLPGDSVQKDGPIFLFGGHRDLGQYLASLEKLLGWADRVDAILPCHHDCPIGPEWIQRNLEDAQSLQAGKLTGEKHPQMPCYVYQGKWTAFLGEAPEIYGN